MANNYYHQQADSPRSQHSQQSPHHTMSANYIPGVDDYYMPPATPVVLAPEPQRFNPDMSAQIAEGIQHMDLNRSSVMSTATTSSYHLPPTSTTPDPAASLSPFPKLIDPSPSVPPSDDDLETRLDSAREHVLNSNDPEMQLAWASDVLIHCGAAADDAERTAAAKPTLARPATPRVEHQLKVDAKSIVTFLADQHHPRAEFMRGMWLEWGRFGEREDKKEAFRCYSRAADKGFARAEYRIGMLYESYNDPVKALRHYHRGVEAGDAASCYRLGMMTLRGQHGQPQDFVKGLDLIKKSAAAADENAAQGAYVYGMLLTRQLPQVDIPEAYLPYDEHLAKENIERAAFMKFAKAQTQMGSAYELGSLGCEFNPALSVHYNALASRQGEADADMALSKWFLVGADGLFPKNEDLAFHYAERAAQSGLATAEFALGYFNEIGMCVPVNLDLAMEWYEKAAKHGNEDARGRIDAIANKHVLSRRDHEKVAISRIKSQHASVRGGRPNQSSAPPVPQLNAPYGSNGNGYDNPAFPPRGSSTTPYPEDNRPAVMAPPQRSASAVPYPDDDRMSLPSHTSPYLGTGPPPGQYYNQGGPRPSTTVNPEYRPSSAFQINPEIRSHSAVPPNTYNAPRPYPNGPPGPGNPPPRSYTAQPYDPHARPMPGYGPPPNGPPVPAKYPPQQPPPPQQEPPNIPQQQQQPGPRMNLGYTAPYEDRRPRPDPTYSEPGQRQRFNSMGMNRPPPSNGQNGAGMGQRKPVSGGNTPRPQQGGQFPPQGQYPPQQQQPQQQVQAKPAPAKPLPKPSGPKTFEEMGVPAQKQNEECVIM